MTWQFAFFIQKIKTLMVSFSLMDVLSQIWTGKTMSEVPKALE